MNYYCYGCIAFHRNSCIEAAIIVRRHAFHLLLLAFKRSTTVSSFEDCVGAWPLTSPLSLPPSCHLLLLAQLFDKLQWLLGVGRGEWEHRPAWPAVGGKVWRVTHFFNETVFTACTRGAQRHAWWLLALSGANSEAQKLSKPVAPCRSSSQKSQYCALKIKGSSGQGGRQEVSIDKPPRTHPGKPTYFLPNFQNLLK